MSERALLRKRSQVERAPEVFLTKIGDADVYDMFWWRTCTDVMIFCGMTNRNDLIMIESIGMST